MHAVILAGGFGTRLGAVAQNTPKALLRVGGRTLIDRIVSAASPHASHIFVTTNARFADQFRSWMQTSPERSKLRLVVEPAQSNAEKLGSIGALGNLLRTEHLEDDLLCVSGDNLFEFKLEPLLAKLRETRAPVFALCDVGSRERARIFGVVETAADGRVLAFEEKPAHPRSSLVSTGVYVFPRASLGAVQEYLSTSAHADAFGHFIRWLSEREPVYGVPFAEKWFDIGTPETYADAQRAFPDRRL